MKEVEEALAVEITKVEVKLTEMLLDLDKAKGGNKLAAQRFRVKSVAIEKEMKNLRKYMMQHG